MAGRVPRGPLVPSYSNQMVLCSVVVIKVPLPLHPNRNSTTSLPGCGSGKASSMAHTPPGSPGGSWGRVSTGFRDRKAAERRAAEIEVQIRSGHYGWTRAPVLTFGQWARTYLKRYTARKRSGRRGRQILAHVLPSWAHRQMDGITRSECAAYINRREAEEAKPGTIVREMGPAQGRVQRCHCRGPHHRESLDGDRAATDRGPHASGYSLRNNPSSWPLATPSISG